MNNKQLLFTALISTVSFGLFTNCTETTSSASATTSVKDSSDKITKPEKTETPALRYEPIDTAAYNRKILALANGDTTGKWPVENQPYPLPGAILPHKRIIAYYGNLYSQKMGILGELPPNQMLARLDQEVKRWEKADPTTLVQPALHYIAVVASGVPGKTGKYRNRMPFKQIDSVLAIARRRENMIVFLDIQVSLGSIRDELPELEQYLKLPFVHLGIDPEFSMKTGARPGTRIGTYDAADINYCSNYLAKLVKENNLPPKVFIIHRFTQRMVTNTQNIKLMPEVQLVMHMDGWGAPELKKEPTGTLFTPNRFSLPALKYFTRMILKSPLKG